MLRGHCPDFSKEDNFNVRGHIGSNKPTYKDLQINQIWFKNDGFLTRKNKTTKTIRDFFHVRNTLSQ